MMQQQSLHASCNTAERICRGQFQPVSSTCLISSFKYSSLHLFCTCYPLNMQSLRIVCNTLTYCTGNFYFVQAFSAPYLGSLKIRAQMSVGVLFTDPLRLYHSHQSTATQHDADTTILDSCY
ncbi:hypothetical protein XENORESO_018015 [Xenotaenia resolanae]|uniref:Uncharacterized protein n=1 Tax=Xenotaenia resolanae TaxID=208358 RepID=A0ABV0WKU8_9TELE